MNNIILPLIVFIALTVTAYIDIKYKKIPSIALTLLLFLVVAIGLQTPANLGYGILAGIFGLLMYEFAEGNNTSFGIADVKVLTIMGFMISTITGFATFLITFAVVQLFYIGYYKFVLKKKGEIPFIPALVIVYILTWILGGFA
jgi:prepilin signal peptidase PulO-like enzyme (type II secretory pathway)